MSLTNVIVPRFLSFGDVFDFISEFETATTALTGDQRMILLARAFPPGRYRAWFETELAPLIRSRADWVEAKAKIISRFSDTEDRDRHIRRIRDMKYDPDGGQRLLDFVEDIFYSFKKAFSNDENEESSVRYVKAAIPDSLKSGLSTIPGYRDATTEDELKKAVRQFDMSRGDAGKTKPSDHIGATELASVLKEIINGIHKEGETTRKSIVAALQGSRGDTYQGYRSEGNNNQRGYSPGRSSYPRPSQDARRSSPNFRDRRSPSPRRFNNQEQAWKPEVNKAVSEGRKVDTQTDEQAFCSEAYFARFGKPPSPCSCSGWHWNRHCPMNLN